MELRHLRYFVAVAEELHFGRAAARLHMAQPPLSQQVRQLEDELGFALFLRANRRVRLTEAGRAFLGDARAVLERVARASESARRVARGETGALAVGFVASATYGLVPTIFGLFRRRHPEVRLTLSELSTAEQVVALRAGDIHVGLARRPLPDDGLAVEPLLEEPLLVALPARHRLRRLAAVPLAALRDEPFVLFPRQPHPGWADFVAGLCRAAGFRPRAAQETQELSTAVALVAAGIGVTLVPASARTLRPRGVIYRPLPDPGPVTQLVALHRPDETSAVLQRFLAVAREVVEGERARAGGR